MSEVETSGVAGAAPLPAAAPLENFAGLNRAHGEFRQWFAKTKTGAERDGAAEKVREFLHRAAATGATLSETRERNAAQAILDYWCAELVSLPQARPDDFKRMRLAEPSSELPSAGAANQPEVTPTSESRELIRLAATARLWRDSGKPGFLLRREALDYAAKFRGVDDDIDKLVRASIRARRKSYIVNTLSVVLGCVIVLVVLYRAVPYLSGRAIDNLRGSVSASAQSRSLRWLGLYQWLNPAPFDISARSTKLEGAKASGLKLNAPNFSNVRFKSVDLQNADLQAASFSHARIKGTEHHKVTDNNFAGANLDRVQFLSARIEDTSFAKAKLYRAIFDQSCFKNVTFSGADLRDASFWNVTFDDKFSFDRNFKNSPWWLAEGWNSSQIKELTSANQDGFEAEALRMFEEPYQRFRQAAQNSLTGPTKPAIWFNNDLAWHLATWGMVSPASAPSPSLSLEQTCDNRSTELAAPDEALTAAENALCIMHRLKKTASTKDLTLWLANLQDTRAYVLLQSGRSTEAAEIYRTDVVRHLNDKEVKPFLNVGGMQFRAAVAYKAIGDDGDAQKLLGASKEEQYVPTHEMHTLKRYIDISEDFKRAIYEQIDTFRPSVPSPAECK